MMTQGDEMSVTSIVKSWATRVLNSNNDDESTSRGLMSGSVSAGVGDMETIAVAAVGGYSVIERALRVTSASEGVFIHVVRCRSVPLVVLLVSVIVVSLAVLVVRCLVHGLVCVVVRLVLVVTVVRVMVARSVGCASTSTGSSACCGSRGSGTLATEGVAVAGSSVRGAIVVLSHGLGSGGVRLGSWVGGMHIAVLVQRRAGCSSRGGGSGGGDLAVESLPSAPAEDEEAKTNENGHNGKTDNYEYTSDCTVVVEERRRRT